MSEQQIRDAYTLAARGREHREELWAQHNLPFQPPTGVPWLAISALAEERPNGFAERLRPSSMERLSRQRCTSPLA